MDYSKKWKIIKDLGEGGQGKVYRVLKLENNQRIEADIMDSLKSLSARIVSYPKSQKENYEKFRNALFDLFKTQDPSQQGALKVLHKPEEARANERIKREIQAMSKNLHSNLIEILDIDPDSTWYVSKFYQNGTLANNKNMFKGDFQKSLKAIRPLVEGVALLHENGYVHRDIKPQNIFLNSNNDFILGDFGLIHFVDEQHTRISETYENVGSRDWMPPWAMGIRIDDIKPSFDVFSLGKLLWWMVSGKSILQLWYFERKMYNVELLFPESHTIKFANPLFKRCIVENEKDCIPSAMSLLSEIDDILKRIEVHAESDFSNKNRLCRVCGIGNYELLSSNETLNFGIRPAGVRTMKIFTCSHCGNVQLFSYKDQVLKAWAD
jgi:serine/threonine protein kinase